MANVFLFFKRPSKTQIIRTVGGSSAPMILDATVKENFKATAEATKHPIEGGADPTDHVILKPKSLSLSGIITEMPLGDFLGSYTKTAGASVASKVGEGLGKFGKGAGAIGGLAGAVLGGAAAKTLSGAIFGSNTRVLGTISQEFVKIRDAKLPLNIQTGLQLYEGYLLTSFSVNRDEKTGNSIKVDLDFEELIIVDSQTTDVAIPKVASALNKKNLGRQSAEAVDSDKNKRGASILKKIFGGG